MNASPDTSVVIPYDVRTAGAALAVARGLRDRVDEVILVGNGSMAAPGSRVHVISGIVGRGRSIRAGLDHARGAVTVLQDPDVAYPLQAYPELTRPIETDRADIVFAAREQPNALNALPDAALGRLSRMVTDVNVKDPLTGMKAIRSEALKAVHLTQDGEGIDAEIVVKMAAQLFRFTEVPVQLVQSPRPSVSSFVQRARALLRYATVANDADNAHEGYNTLLRMDSAPNYNAWLGKRLRPHLGKRILEIGAGIGTITKQIEEGRELVIALEVDPFYVDRLKNLFRGKPHVRPYLSNVELADWPALKAERIDSIIQSNVLEHIEDDGEAVRRFRQVLQPGGKLVTLVPALPALFGTMDEAVGHFRRYTPAMLRKVMEENGFVVETLEWMNVVGIPGWFVNGKLLKRRAVPPLQLRLYDQLAPLLARAESRLKLPLGMSLIAVARAA